MSPAWVSAFTSGMKMMMVGTGSMKSPTIVKSSTISSMMRCGSLPAMRGDPVGDHDGAAQIGQHPAECVGGADGDQRQREDQPGEAEIVGHLPDMSGVERGDHDEDDPDHRDHAGFGRREPAGENAAEQDHRDHQRQRRVAGGVTTCRTARAVRMPGGPEEIAIDHQAEADHQPGHDAGHEQAGDRDVANRAVDHGGDAWWHQRGNGGGER